MLIELQERIDVTQARIERKAEGLIRNVKVLGRESRNGRRYSKRAILKAAALYEGCRVNIDHGNEPNTPRSYRDRLGSLCNVRVSESGLFADLKYNPKHPCADQLAWDAQHAPENLGLSHNAQARTRRDAHGQVVEDIVSVKSVDLVADPASTSTLFESVNETNAPPRNQSDRIARLTGSRTRFETAAANVRRRRWLSD